MEVNITPFVSKASHCSNSASQKFLNSAPNLSFVLMQVMTDAYGSLRFSAIFSFSILMFLSAGN